MIYPLIFSFSPHVALLAEGVDRNFVCHFAPPFREMSPSSRRAWIEIPTGRHAFYLNRTSPSSRRAWIEIELAQQCRRALESPSSRRAWIEIVRTGRARPAGEVALLAEGVDRNKTLLSSRSKTGRSPSSRRAWIEIVCAVLFGSRILCRPPRGGRG